MATECTHRNRRYERAILPEPQPLIPFPLSPDRPDPPKSISIPTVMVHVCDDCGAVSRDGVLWSTLEELE